MSEERDMLDELIVDLVENLSALEDGSREKSMAVDDIAKLYKIKLDAIKLNIDADDKENRRVLEEMNFQKEIEFKEAQTEKEAELRAQEIELKQKELNELKLDRWFKAGLTVFEIVTMLFAYGHWTKMGFRFEETGTIRSNTMKNIFMKPKKLKMK